MPNSLVSKNKISFKSRYFLQTKKSLLKTNYRTMKQSKLDNIVFEHWKSLVKEVEYEGIARSSRK